MKDLIGLNEFVERQVKGSRFSYYDGSFEDLVVLCTKELLNVGILNVHSPYEGVLLLKVNPDKFYSGLVKVNDDTILTASFIKRQEKEAPFINVTAKGTFEPALCVEIVLYSYDRLRLKNEQCTECDWEIISINAYPFPNSITAPMTPITMARNYLDLEGGTKSEYTPEEFAQSIVFWSKHVMIEN